MFPYRHPDPTTTTGTITATTAAAANKRRRRRTCAINDDDSSQQDVYIPSWNEALEGGGLLQMAMKGDLLDFRRHFETTLTNALGGVEGQTSGLGGGDGNGIHHHKAGSAFQVFLSAFGRARMALLHSELAPPVYDRGSYSQLIYATCLSLLRDAMDSDEIDSERGNGASSETGPEPTARLVRSAFAIFTLHAMYETNPLKRSDDRIPGNHHDRMISMLPTSLSYPRENMHFRRAFRQPIRVDVDTYELICGAVPDVARQQIARCEASRSQCLQSRLSGVPSTDYLAREIRDWRCTCALAQDVIQVLHRLEPHWDCASYSGPCGLEAMAGHPDYPWKASAPNTLPVNAVVGGSPEISGVSGSIMSDPPMVDSEIAASDELALDKGDLTTQLKEYLRCCSEIRFPVQATQRIQRAREAIRPIFNTSLRGYDDAATDLAHLVDAALNGSEGVIPESSAKKRSITIKRRHVTFSIDVPDDRTATTRSVPPPLDGRSLDEADRHEDDGNGPLTATDVLHELVLPSGLTELQEQSLADAVETILKRGEFPRGPGIVDAAASHADTGEVSTLGGISALHSRASGVGRSALQALLSQAGQASSAATTGVVVTRDSFLDDLDEDASARQALGAGNDNDMDDAELSDLSDDGLSVAASAVGRKALDVLISRSMQEGTAAPETRKLRPKHSRRRQSTRAGSKAVRESTADSDGESINLLEDASMAASAVGRKALSNLSLSRGEGELKLDDESDDQRSAMPITRRRTWDGPRDESASHSSVSTGTSLAKRRNDAPARSRRKQPASRIGLPEPGTSQRTKTARAATSKRTSRSGTSAKQKDKGSNGSSSVSTRRSKRHADDASRGAGQQALDDLLFSL